MTAITDATAIVASFASSSDTLERPLTSVVGIPLTEAIAIVASSSDPFTVLLTGILTIFRFNHPGTGATILSLNLLSISSKFESNSSIIL